MKKLCIFILMVLIIALIGTGNGMAGSAVKPSETPNIEKEYLAEVELGNIDANDLVSTLKKKDYLIVRISHSAVANYMEALANEGMLEIIPIPYYSYEDIKTALEVVFHDRENVIKNWDVFEDHWISVRSCE